MKTNKLKQYKKSIALLSASTVILSSFSAFASSAIGMGGSGGSTIGMGGSGGSGIGGGSGSGMGGSGGSQSMAGPGNDQQNQATAEELSNQSGSKKKNSSKQNAQQLLGGTGAVSQKFQEFANNPNISSEKKAKALDNIYGTTTQDTAQRTTQNVSSNVNQLVTNRMVQTQPGAQMQQGPQGGSGMQQGPQMQGGSSGQQGSQMQRGPQGGSSGQQGSQMQQGQQGGSGQQQGSQMQQGPQGGSSMQQDSGQQDSGQQGGRQNSQQGESSQNSQGSSSSRSGSSFNVESDEYSKASPSGFITMNQRNESNSEFNSSLFEGLSAGSEYVPQYGVWAQGIASRSKQSYYKESSGYKSRAQGGIIGADTKVNEVSSVGFVLTKVDGAVRMKDDAVGFSTKTKTSMATLYGMYNITPSWYVRASSSTGLTSVTSKGVTYLDEQSLSKYKSRMVSGGVGTGYSHYFSNGISVGEDVGLDLSKSFNKAYADVSPSFNKYFGNSHGSSVYGSGSIYVSKGFAIKEYWVSPSLSASVSQRLGGKNTTTRLKIDEFYYESKSKDLTIRTWTLGSSLSVSRDNINYSFDYGLSKMKHFVSHSGSLKVRVNF